MKQIIFLSILLFFMGACSHEESVSKLSDKGSYINVNFDSFTCPTQGLCEFTVMDNSSIDLNTSSKITKAQITKGHKVVFQYRYTYDDKADVMDDEYVEIIMFEIDPSQSQFEYRDEDLKHIKAAGAKLCYCEDAGFYALERGVIKGQKLSDNSWDIAIYIRHNMYEDEAKMISSNFVLE